MSVLFGGVVAMGPVARILAALMVLARMMRTRSARTCSWPALRFIGLWFLGTQNGYRRGRQQYGD
jgi:hypothetical protein